MFVWRGDRRGIGADCKSVRETHGSFEYSTRHQLFENLLDYYNGPTGFDCKGGIVDARRG